MRRIMFLACAALVLASCGADQSESDFRAFGKMMCKTRQMEEKVANGDRNAMKEEAQQREAMEAMGRKMKEKYGSRMEKDDALKQQYRRIIDEEMANCK